MEQGFVKDACLRPSCSTSSRNVAYTRSKADKYVMDALVQLKTRTGTGGRGEATAGEPAVAMLV